MTRDEFMELVYETFADEPDNVLANGIIEAADAYAEHEKAQLSPQGTTSDLISRTETVEHLRRVLEATVPNTDYDEGFIDGVEFGISTVSTMPSAQPVATDTNVGDTISRQQAIDALWKALHEYEGKTEKQFQESEDLDVKDWIEHRIFVQNMNDIDRQTILNLPSAQPEPCDDLISRQAAIDALKNRWKKTRNYEGIGDDIAEECELYLKQVPPAQPEPQEGHWIRTDCGLDVECKCSKCGYRDFVEPRDEYWFKRNFRPNCGAKMKGERQK